METQKCSKCGNEYEINFFPIRPETGKRRSECKLCHNAYQRVLYLEKVGKFKREVRGENRESDPKQCIRCRRIKPLSEFNIHNHKKGQHKNLCKQCQYEWAQKFNQSPHGKELREEWNKENREKIEQYRELYKNDPDKKAKSKEYQREYWLKKEFNMTLEEYNNLLQKQDGKCAICGTNNPGNKKNKNFPVDHDPKTGKVRGLLCHNCNIGIGNLRHDPSLLRSAIDYLGRY